MSGFHTDGFILAAGLGTRLRVLTQWTPKPLLPVQLETPFSRTVSAMRHAGISNIVCNASYLAEQLKQAAAAHEVLWSEEQDYPLGTAGGFSRAQSHFKTDWATVWNADIWTSVNPGVLDCCTDAPITLMVHGLGAPGSGNIGFADDGRIVRLREVRIAQREQYGAFYSCVARIHRSVWRHVPPQGCLVGDFWIPQLKRGIILKALVHASPWIDIGTMDSYIKANFSFDAASLVDPSAHIASSVLIRRSVIGREVSVASGVTLAHCIVWPGVHVKESHENAVLCTSKEVVLYGV